ncbi:hypothetical protein KYB31_23485 [Clostridium felsineum]|uniref:hypothetical protein n=1 Tax=Clostridium felsineum TaxID=36839 RepID=UPI00214D9749|nr:hypothetical protein [Clostridium felsineum]MCR3761938.1 hypothetical protein [Clostridium felsineum]
MVEKIRLNKKIIVGISLIIITVLVSIITVYAEWIPISSPEIDIYRNGSMSIPSDYPINGGSGVEYNGFRIGNTVWCKKGDVLGVTTWEKQKRADNDMKNSINTSFLSLGGTISLSKFSINQPFDSEGHTGEFNVIAKSDDITLVSSRRGRTVDTKNFLHYGALFWLQFNVPNKTYLIRSNASSYNGSWLADENDFSKWPLSNENIKTDGTSPDMQINFDSATSINKDINIDMKFSDEGSGMQYYQYQIIKDGQQIDNKTCYPQYHSDITANSYFVTEDDKALYNNNQATGGYVDSYDPEKTAIPYAINKMEQELKLSGVGNYTVKITAVDNLGNTCSKSYNYSIIAPPPVQLNAQIVPYNNQGFQGTPTLKRGQKAILKIFTKQYATHINATFPFIVFPDGKAVQNCYIKKPYDSFTSKSIDIVPQVSAETDIQFVVPLTYPTINNGSYNVPVQAIYKEGSVLNTTASFNVQGSVLDGIKTEIIGSGQTKGLK